MKEVVITSKVVGREGAGVPAKIGQGSTVDLSAYLLKAIWDKVWEIRTDSTGKEYIFGKLPVVTQYGITMYVGDGGDIDLPSLYAGLPIDNATIYWENGVLKAVGSSGGGGVADSVAWGNVTGKPSWITDAKPTYAYYEITGTPDLTKYALQTDIPSLSGYATEQWVISKGYALDADLDALSAIVGNKADKTELAKYIPISGYTEVSGEKNFTGGLKVNGSPIVYDATNKYWKLEGDLLVTGGVTMYANEGTYTPSTIMDALLYDDTTLGINSEGKLYVKGGTGGGLDITELQNYLTQNSYLNVTEGDGRYLKLSGGTLTGALNLSIGAYNYIGSSIALCVQSDTPNALRLYTPSGRPALAFFNNDGWKGTLGVNENSDLLWSANKVWHAGNDGSGSELDADMLDGQQGSYYTPLFNNSPTLLTNSHNLNNYTKGYYGYKDGINPSNNFGNNTAILALQSVRGTDTWQIAFDGNNINNTTGPLIGIRGNLANQGWTAWFTLATVSSNVASATKLQTARTIWGQSFDGTGNITGQLNITTVNNVALTNGTGSLTIGPMSNVHIAIDNNDIQAKANGTTASILYLNDYGGSVSMCRGGGNVGIGTASPKSRLSIETIAVASNPSLGSLATSNTVGIGNAGYKTYFWTRGSGNGYIQVGREDGNTTAYHLILQALGGNVGIGKEDPQYKLDIVGNVRLTGGWYRSKGAYGWYSEDYAGGWYMTDAAWIRNYNSKPLLLEIGSNNTNGIGGHRVGLTLRGASHCSIMMIGTNGGAGYGWGIGANADGNFYVGRRTGESEGYSSSTDSYKFRLDGSGNGLFYGGVTMYSDQRKKTILRNVELSLKEVANAPLIEHYYNSDDKKTTHVGSIAQYWAGMNDWFCKLDNEGYYTMEIQNAALASAISVARELDRYETKTDKKIKQLKKRICQLEDELERLKSA